MVLKFAKRGLRHVKNNSDIEDYTCYLESERFLVIALADGVSTCSNSKAGAKVAAEALAKIFFQKAEYFFEFSESRICDYVMSHVLYELNKCVSTNGGRLEDYSSTLAAVLYDRIEEKYIVLNLGDSLILASGFGKTEIIGKPSDSTSGCPCTTTINAKALTNITKLNGAFEAVTIMSDGAWRELFDRNELKKETEAMFINGDFDGLQAYLNEKNINDDSSFITAKIM